MTLTPKQRLAMLVDENELPKKPPSPPPAPKQEPTSASPATSRSYKYYNDSDDGIYRGPRHNERRMNADLPERFKKLATNDHSMPTPSSAPNDRTSTSDARSKPALAVGTATTGSFCPIVSISKFPYKYIRDSTAKQNIASGFFDSQKFWDNLWDLYYVWPPASASVTPLVLVSHSQVESLIQRVQQKLGGSCPSLSTVDNDYGICLAFDDPHPNLQPRYLGRSHSQADYKSLEAAIPGQPYRPPHETPPTSRPTEEAQTHFTCLLEYATEINRSRQSRRSAKIARLNDRLQKAQDWRKGFEQAERTFGLRAVALSAHGGFGSGQGNQWQANQARWATEEASRNPPPVHPLRPVPHPFDSEPVLIAVDVEAYERAPSRITEIGISTLDTRDLKGVAPGWFGAHWCPYIRSRHVRIIENAHLENSQFVTGCANDFRFGVSEMVHEAVIQEYIATFFRPPFSKLAEQQKASTFTVSPVEDISDDEERRTIVLVGHSFDNDLRYLRGLGYNPRNLPTLHPITPILDTQHLYRTLTSSRDSLTLAKILQAVDITPWGLHNAGNDARYTMEALLGVVVGSACGRGGGVEGGFGGEVGGGAEGEEGGGEEGEEGGVKLEMNRQDEAEVRRKRDLRRGFPSFSAAIAW